MTDLRAAEDTIHGLRMSEFREQLWQVPARVMCAYGASEGDACLVGERLVEAGLVTVESALAFLALRPQYAPRV